MNRPRISITLHARAPISHGAFGPSTGTATLFRRVPVVSLPGMPRIPVISGNSLRGVLRRIVMRELLSRGGMTKESPGWDHLYAALVNGGHLSGSETSLDPLMVQALRASLPPLSVFGAALRTWMLEGRMSVGICWPRCSELGTGDVAVEDMVDEYSHVRHIERTAQDPDVTGVTPMPTNIEVLSTGTVLDSYVQFHASATEVERSVIAHGLDQLSSVGAKSAAGLGCVDVEHDGDAAPYREWLASIDPEPLAALAAKLAAAEGKKKAKKNARTTVDG